VHLPRQRRTPARPRHPDDGEKIAIETIYYHPTEMFDISDAVPAALLGNKTRITAKFQAAPGASTGGVLDVRTVRMPAR
jgi:hypothetical protein